MKAIPTLPQPKFWQQMQWIFNPVGYLKQAQAQCPDICRANALNFGGMESELIMVNHPQALQELLTNDRKLFTAPGQFNWILLPLIGNSSVIMLDGDRHRKRRQLVMPSFHGDRLRNYGELIQSLSHRVMERYQPGQRFLAREASQTLSLQVIFKTVFGFADGEKYDRLKYLLSSLADLFNSTLTSAFLFFPQAQKNLGAWSPWGKFLCLRQELDQLLFQEIGDRRANPDPTKTDILTLLMASKDDQGEGMSDQELRDELMTLLFAGHETTATAMAWALYWLHHQPETQAKLLEELASLGESPDPLAILRLPYLNAFCNETLRIHPIAMLTFPRQAQEDLTLFGYPIKAGAVVMGSIYQTHQRPDLYPDPQTFNPDRFLERQYSPYEFFPFGGGVRRCVGEALAQFEMKIALATIVQNYQLTLADNRPEKPQRRGVTLAPTRGVPMIMQGKKTVTQPQKSLAVAL